METSNKHFIKQPNCQEASFCNIKSQTTAILASSERYNLPIEKADNSIKYRLPVLQSLESGATNDQTESAVDVRNIDAQRTEEPFQIEVIYGDTRSAESFDFDEVNAVAMENWEAVLDELGVLNDGKLSGQNYQMLNPKRNDNNLGSFSINIESGKWAEFACDEASGTDIISLVAYIRNVNNYKAKEWLAEYLGMTGDAYQAEAISSTSAIPKVEKPTSNNVYVTPIPKLIADYVMAWENGGRGRPTSHFGVRILSTQVFPYRDHAGNILSLVLRHNLPEGKKTFLSYTYWSVDGEKPMMQFKAPPQPYTLFNLDKLAAQPDAPILITEGEKKSLAAEILFPNHVVVTTRGGANNPLKTDLSPLAGRVVTIWPDNDAPGMKYADTIAEHLKQANPESRVQILIPPCFKPMFDASGKAVLEPSSVELPGGWDAADAQADGWTAEHIYILPEGQFVEYGVPLMEEADPQTDGFHSAEQREVFVEVQPEKIETHAIGYEIVGPMSGGKLCFSKLNPKTEEMEYKDVSSAIVALALSRDEVNQNWGTLVSFYDPDGTKHEVSIPKELMSSGAAVSCTQELLNRGLMVENDRLLKTYLMTATPTERVLCVKQVGWHRDVFVLPDLNYGANPERVVLQTADMIRVSAYAVQGTLEEWKQNVASLCAGNSRLIFSLATALAGPFLKLLNMENGGFHFRGNSSSGKSKALAVAASVWGNKEVVRSWRTTDNAIESLALVHNDTFLALDELSQTDPDKAGEIAYTLGNGTAKARANRNGNIRQILRWRLLFLSTGEIGLASHMATSGVRTMAGQEVRMLDIPAMVANGHGIFESIHGKATGSEFADCLGRMADQYFGTAGVALLELITDQEEQQRAVEYVRAKMNDFLFANVPGGSHGQIYRAANRFALVAAVGEYAITCGILPFEVGAVAAGVKRCFDDWMLERGGNEAMEDARALRQVRAYLERHGESRFASTEKRCSYMNDAASSVARSHQRTGYRHETDGVVAEYWVLPEMFVEEICRGFDPKVMTKMLTRKGYLALDSQGRPQIAKRLPGMSAQQRVYVIKACILQDEEDQQSAA